MCDFVPGGRHRFTTVPRPGEHGNWHARKRRTTPLAHWRQYMQQGHEALTRSEGGVITIMPQLAATVALQKRLVRRPMPLVAWFFNTELEARLRLREARITLRAVDRFVVHSTREIGLYADLLHLPAERFAFAPLQYGGELATDPIDEVEPFVFATGSGYRDYGTFFRAVEKLGYRTLVLAGERALRGLTPPPSVEILDQIPKHEIHRLVRRARVNVVPMTEGGANAGLVTMVEAYRHERAIVSTWRPGVEDYVFPGQNALVHDLGDADGLAQAIEALWTDAGLREELNIGARKWAEEHATDDAAGRLLGFHLDQLADAFSHRG
ncbi:MAG: glycosyltransferase [Acidimicrobiales bacterium]